MLHSLIGKVFPKLRRKARQLVNMNNRRNTQSESDDPCPPGGGIEMAVNGGDLSDDEESTDYVFRIITADTNDRMCKLTLTVGILR